MSKEIPIFFMHKSNSDYLKYSVNQACISNPRSDIYLAGDSENNVYPDLNHLMIDDYGIGAQRFESVYEHLSTNSLGFELFCFQRWYVLLEIMQANKLPMVFFADSDLMIYGNISEESEKLEECKMAYCCPGRQGKLRWMASAHASYWTQEGLTRFCDFMLEMYEGEGMNKLRQKWDWQQSQGLPGGVCDMTLLYLFYEKNKEDIANLLEIREGAAFDLSVNVGENAVADEYKVKGNYKFFEWKDQMPYAQHLKKNIPVRFNTIHFQERAKLLMHKFYQGSDLKYARGVSELKRISLTTARKLKAKLS